MGNVNTMLPRKALAIIGLAVIGLSAAATTSEIQLAIDHPDRTASDQERDLTSKPAEFLGFCEVRRGHVVLDLFAGGGYYSELTGRIVGESGTVYMHNNGGYLGFAGKALAARTESGRLRNVTRYDKEIDAIDLPSDSVDRVLMVMTYHDLYYKTDGWDINPDVFFAAVQRVLKPGGMLCIVDHAGRTETQSADAQDLHRIDPVFARADIEARGFTFGGENTALHNPQDKLDVNVFDPSVRRKTSRFIYKFVLPAVEPAG